MKNPILKKLLPIVAKEYDVTVAAMKDKTSKLPARWMFYFVAKEYFDIPYSVSTDALGGRNASSGTIGVGHYLKDRNKDLERKIVHLVLVSDN